MFMEQFFPVHPRTQTQPWPRRRRPCSQVRTCRTQHNRHATKSLKIMMLFSNFQRSIKSVESIIICSATIPMTEMKVLSVTAKRLLDVFTVKCETCGEAICLDLEEEFCLCKGCQLPLHSGCGEMCPDCKPLKRLHRSPRVVDFQHIQSCACCGHIFKKDSVFLAQEGLCCGSCFFSPQTTLLFTL
jgi:hypothetical protein